MITNRDELAATVDRWLRNSTLTVEIPDLIAIAEQTLRRRLKIDATEFSTTLPTATSTDLPNDCGAVLLVKVTGSTMPPLRQQTYEALQALEPNAGPATVYAIFQRKLFFWPTTPAQVDLSYSRKLPALTQDAPGNVNWLLTEAPDLYLFATLVEAEAFGMKDDRVEMWRGKRDGIIADILKDSSERQYGRDSLVCRRISE